MKLALGGFSPDSLLRKILPRSLLGRSLLIVLVPLVLLQAVALQIFYGSHLDELSRRGRRAARASAERVASLAFGWL